MGCRIIEFRKKDVINIKNGLKYGRVDDVEIDTANAELVSIIIEGRARFFGLLGREDDLVIPWADINIIGEDTILVNYTEPARKIKKHTGFFEKFFG